MNYERIWYVVHVKQRIFASFVPCVLGEEKRLVVEIFFFLAN